MTLSWRNTPVERQWRDLAPCLTKWKDRFVALEKRGYLKAGNNYDPVDLFCLHRVFLPDVKRTYGQFYQGMWNMNKRKSTLNPSFPEGTQLRRHLFSKYGSAGCILSRADLIALRQVGMAYWGPTHKGFLPRVWGVDPVSSEEGRQVRDKVMEMQDPAASLEDIYLLFRHATNELKNGGL